MSTRFTAFVRSLLWAASSSSRNVRSVTVAVEERLCVSVKILRMRCVSFRGPDAVAVCVELVQDSRVVVLRRRRVRSPVSQTVQECSQRMMAGVFLVAGVLLVAGVALMEMLLRLLSRLDLLRVSETVWLLECAARVSKHVIISSNHPSSGVPY